MTSDQTQFVSISLLLKRLSTLESARKVSAEEVAAAVSLIFTNRLSPIQFGLLLWALHTTNLDHQAEVLAACASSMREAAHQVDETALVEVLNKQKRPEGTYSGGLVFTHSPATLSAGLELMVPPVRHRRDGW
jgi:anthranilate phosphoribosyltransferase